MSLAGLVVASLFSKTCWQTTRGERLKTFVFQSNALAIVFCSTFAYEPLMKEVMVSLAGLNVTSLCSKNCLERARIERQKMFLLRTNTLAIAFCNTLACGSRGTIANLFGI